MAAAKLSIVVPCFNDEGHVRPLVERVRGAGALGLDKELVLVDSASRDGTRAEIDALLADPELSVGLRVVSLPRNEGRGAALRKGLAEATGDFVMTHDADPAYDPRDYDVLLPPLLDGRADVVFGSRRTSTPRWLDELWQAAVDRGIASLSSLATDLKVNDVCGCFKLFRREILRQITLEEDRGGIDAELVAKLARLRVRVYEVPVLYSERAPDGTGLLDDARSIYAIAKYGFLRC